jgi:hypothetical protein
VLASGEGWSLIDVALPSAFWEMGKRGEYQQSMYTDVHRNPWLYVLLSEKTVQALSTVIEALVVCQNLDKKK